MQGHFVIARTARIPGVKIDATPRGAGSADADQKMIGAVPQFCAVGGMQDDARPGGQDMADQGNRRIAVVIDFDGQGNLNQRPPA